MVEKMYARPCVGCGYCCLLARCAISFTAEGEHYLEPGEPLEADACPWLRWDSRRYRCSIADKYPEGLAIGAGCCSPLNSIRRGFLAARLKKSN